MYVVLLVAFVVVNWVVISVNYLIRLANEENHDISVP